MTWADSEILYEKKGNGKEKGDKARFSTSLYKLSPKGAKKCKYTSRGVQIKTRLKKNTLKLFYSNKVGKYIKYKHTKEYLPIIKCIVIFSDIDVV